MEKNKPVRTLWRGNVKANIWENKTQNGAIFSANYARIYTDKHGKIREAYTFSGDENLRLEAVARQAGDLCQALQQEFNAQNNAKNKAKAKTPEVAQAASPDETPAETPAADDAQGVMFQMTCAPQEI
ncbi:MAG: hypothetical protein AAGA09_03145 [Pseudomonadota bacterium]